MSVVLDFTKALASKVAATTAEEMRRQKNAELIAKYRPNPPVRAIDPTHDLRAIKEHEDNDKPFKFVSFLTEDDLFPPPKY